MSQMTCLSVLCVFLGFYCFTSFSDLTSKNPLHIYMEGGLHTFFLWLPWLINHEREMKDSGRSEWSLIQDHCVSIFSVSSALHCYYSSYFQGLISDQASFPTPYFPSEQIQVSCNSYCTLLIRFLDLQINEVIAKCCKWFTKSPQENLVT